VFFRKRIKATNICLNMFAGQLYVYNNKTPLNNAQCYDGFGFKERYSVFLRCVSYAFKCKTGVSNGRKTRLTKQVSFTESYGIWGTTVSLLFCSDDYVFLLHSIIIIHWFIVWPKNWQLSLKKVSTFFFFFFLIEENSTFFKGTPADWNSSLT
jgi:hypothetical protein